MPRSSVVGAPLLVERLPNGRRRLVRDFVVRINDHKGWKPITVRAPFVTDYSSIPTLLSWVVRWSRVDIAGVVHDWLYRYGERPRKDADEVWWLVARSGKNRANSLQAGLCWVALRGFGVPTWNGYCEHNKATREKVPLWTVLPLGVALFVVLWILTSLPELDGCVLEIVEKCCSHITQTSDLNSLRALT